MSDDQKTYDLTCLISSELSEEQNRSWVERLRGSIEAKGGSLIEEPELRQQALAYPIKKKKTATLLSIAFSAPPSVPEAVGNELRHEAAILRYLIIEIPENHREAATPRAAKEIVGPDTVFAGDASVGTNDNLTEIDKRIEEILKSAS